MRRVAAGVYRTLDGRYEVRRSGLRGQNHRWEVRDLVRHGTLRISVFGASTKDECRAWVEAQS